MLVTFVSPTKSGDGVSGADSGGPKEPYTRWDQDPPQEGALEGSQSDTEAL